MATHPSVPSTSTSPSTKASSSSSSTVRGSINTRSAFNLVQMGGRRSRSRLPNSRGDMVFGTITISCVGSLCPGSEPLPICEYPFANEILAATGRCGQHSDYAVRLPQNILPAAGKHAQSRDLSDRPCLIKEQRQSRLQRRERRFPGAHNAGHWVLPDGLYPFCLSQNDSPLRATNQLVGAATDQVARGANRIHECGFILQSELRYVEQWAGPQVVVHDDPVSARFRLAC